MTEVQATLTSNLRASEVFFKADERNPTLQAGMPKGQIGFKRLNDYAVLPKKAHATDSGYDLYAAEDVIIEPGQTEVVPTGIAVQLPEGCEAQVRPRSGVTSKTKLRVQLGTIDNGYNGEIGIIVDNTATESDFAPDSRYVEFLDGSYYRMDEMVHDGTYLIRKGDKLAQMVVQQLPSVKAYEITGEIVETERGAKGYGSTGTTKEANE